MKFGIFYELQLPRPWAPGDEHRLYQNALEQIEIADRLGYDHAWQVEHHFLEEYSHSPVPESFLAAASQRTRQIRLGHGIMQLTTNHPARCAERIASLDLLSNGRCEFGMGESASITELEPFGVDMADKREIFEEAVRAIMPMFKDGPSEHHGKYFKMPLRHVMPKPMQKPHPPLWVACSNIQTIGKAGEWGMGALGFTFVTPEAARAWSAKPRHGIPWSSTVQRTWRASWITVVSASSSVIFQSRRLESTRARLRCRTSTGEAPRSTNSSNNRRASLNPAGEYKLGCCR